MFTLSKNQIASFHERNLGSLVSFFDGLALLSYCFRFIRWQTVSLDPMDHFLLESRDKLLRDTTRKQQEERKERQPRIEIEALGWGDIMIVYQIG